MIFQECIQGKLKHELGGFMDAFHFCRSEMQGKDTFCIIIHISKICVKGFVAVKASEGFKILSHFCLFVLFSK